MGNKDVSAVRFPGFSDDWEQRNLGELAPLRGGVAFKSDEFQEDGIPIVRISNILRSGEVGGSFTYYPEQEKDDNYLLPDKSAVLAMSGATTGKVSILCIPNGGKVYQNQRVGYFTKTEGADYGFVSTITRSPMFVEQLGAMLVAGAQPNISSKDIDTITFYVPTNLEEQTKIGNFFNQLDKTIALHQQELTTLNQTKQGFLQKMFPKESESVPEVRFPGFCGEWESTKAKTIFKAISEKNHPELPILSASQEKGMIYRNDIGINISYDEKSTITYKKVVPGQFVIHLRSFQGGLAFSNIEGITSPAYTVLDFINIESHYPVFWKNVLTSKSFIKKLEGVTYGIRDGRSISYHDFSTLKFRVPSYEEQVQIGNFFKRLDYTIALQEKELEALQQTKKAFLQKMFV